MRVQEIEPKRLQLNLTPFLGAKNARELMGGLPGCRVP